MGRTVMLSVDVLTDAELPRTCEVLSRAMAGMALEGLDARLYVYESEDEG